MKTILDLANALDAFFGGINNGDKYIGSDPELEDGLQLDLYKYLLKEGFLAVYELGLPNLKPYLDQEINESVRGMSSTVKDSLKPDIVVNLGTNGYACIELKYNEKNETECIEDAAKSRVYVKHCLGVCYAVSINLSQEEMDGFEPYACADPNYVYNTYECWDKNARYDGYLKARDAYSITELWARRSLEIANGHGKFAKFGY